VQKISAEVSIPHMGALGMKKGKTLAILFILVALFMGIEGPPRIETERTSITSPITPQIPDLLELDQNLVADAPPVVITSNSDFVSQGWPGAGIPGNPYRIENLTIASPNYCIYIEDTDVHFIIRNCSFSGNTWGTEGVRLDNVTHGIIDSCIMTSIERGILGTTLSDVSISNSTITGCSITGLYLSGANCTIQNNAISQTNDQTGIYITESYNITIKSNTIHDHKIGLSLYESTLCNIIENELINAGVSVYSATTDENRWHHYFSDNTVDGRNIGYFWNASSSVITGDYGLLILANCTDMTVIDSIIQNTAMGITLGLCSNTTIENATLANVLVGVYNIRSSNTTITSMISSGTEYDLYATRSPYLTLMNSTIDSEGYGVYGDHSEFSKIINNTITSQAAYAISLDISDNLLIDNNTLLGAGMYLFNCDHSDIFNNSIMSVKQYGIRSMTSLDLRIIGNEFHGCGLHFEGAISYWEQEVDDNTVNGQPLLYHWDASNLTIESVSCNQVILANCWNISLSDLTLSNTTVGIQVGFSNNISISNIHVSDCFIGVDAYETVSEKLSDIDSQGCNIGMEFYFLVNSSISNVNATGNEDALYFAGCYNITVQNSLISDNIDKGLDIRNSDVFWIENCTLQNCDDGIDTDNCDNLTIIDSKFLNNNQGCELNGNYLTLLNDTVSWNEDGINIYSSDYSNITQNTITENTDESLRIWSSDNFTVSNNTIEWNRDGLEISYSFLVGVFNNSLSYNDYGILLDEATNTSVIDNLVYLNRELGINVDSYSVNNTFYANQIGGGAQGNAVDHGTTNYWDNGIDTGNAWSDYSGSPTYAIPGAAGSVDHYPTMFEDNEAPIIDHPEDIESELGSEIYLRVTWYPLDLTPESYEIFIDDVVFRSDDWDGDSIDVAVSGYSYGVHNFTLRVTDGSGLSSSDTVFVNIWTTPGALVVASNSDFTLRGFVGVGSPLDPYTISGLDFSLNGTCIYIFDTTAYFIISGSNVSSDGIIGGYGIILSNVEHGTISDCSVSGKETGIYGIDADYCTISDNEVYGNSHSGILIESSSYGNIVSSNKVYENGWGASLSGGMLPGGGIAVGQKTDIWNNYVYDNDFSGILVASSSPCSIMDNVLVGNGFYVMYEEHNFLRNTVNGKAFGYLIGVTDTVIDASTYGQLYLLLCRGVSIINAEFDDATIGIWLDNCLDCVIENCSFSYNSIIGAALFYSDNCTIRNSKIFGNERMGLYVARSDFTDISQNAIVGNAYVSEPMSQSGGVILYGPDNCTFSDNLVFNNTAYGIDLTSSEGSKIIGNRIGSNNGTGISLRYSDDECEIYNNKIGWNTEYNAYDSNSENIWDDNLSHGNYWSDYQGSGTYPIPLGFNVDDRYPSLLTDSGSPTISSISDFGYELEFSPLVLEWDVSDENPASFMLYRNGSLVDYGAWTSGLLQLEAPLPGPGTYEFDIVVYDLAMNAVNDSVIITATDTTSPEWGTTPSDQTIELGFNVQYQLLAIDNDRIDHYWINDTITFSIDSTGIIRNVISLDIGRYGLQVEAYDTSGYNCTAEITIFVQDTTGPTWVQIPSDQQITVEQSFRYDLNATDYSGIETWTLNDTARFAIDSNGVITNLVDLELGSYGLNVTVSDSLGNTRIAVFKVTVTEIPVTTTTTTTTTTSTITVTITTTTSIPPLDPVTLSFTIVGGLIGIVIVLVYIGRRKGKI